MGFKSNLALGQTGTLGCTLHISGHLHYASYQTDCQKCANESYATLSLGTFISICDTFPIC